ncbi:uncharacterized protein DS421_10g294580 [Arachis hypogaea]|nr:uncharacterized protein DS421_10g294580 [Arachis hypogaea]
MYHNPQGTSSDYAQVSMVEPELEDLGILLVEIEFVLNLGTLSEVESRVFGGARVANGSTKAVGGGGLGIGVDVGLENVKEENWENEECEEEGERSVQERDFLQ